MNKIGQKIVKLRYVLLALFALMIVIALCLTNTMLKKVNLDVTDYLPTDGNSSRGYSFISDNFDIHADVELAVHTSDKDAMSAFVGKIKANSAVSMVVWEQDTALLTDFGIFDVEDDEYKQIQSILKQTVTTSDGTANTYYLVMIALSVAPSSEEGLTAFEQIDGLAKDSFGDNYFVTGMTKHCYEQFHDVVDEIWIYAIIALIILFAVLLIASRSLMEPIVVVVSVLVALVLSVCSNVIFESTSLITLVGAVVLMFATALDFSLIIVHSYRDEIKRTPNKLDAMANAVCKSFKPLSVSTLVLIGAFCALIPMRFSLSADLAFALIKGVVLCYATALLFTPSLALALDKLRAKTQYKTIDTHLRPVVKASIKHRNMIALLFVPLLVVSIFANVGGTPLSLKYTYAKFFTNKEVREQLQPAKDMSLNMCNEVMLALPCYSYTFDKNGNPTILVEDYIDEQYEFIDAMNTLKSEGKINFTLGIFSMLPEGSTLSISGLGLSVKSSEVVKLAIENPALLQATGYGDLIGGFLSNGYTICTIGINAVDVEDDAVYATLSQIKSIADNVFASCGEVYITGYPEVVADLAAVTPSDYALLCVVAVVLMLVLFALSLGEVRLALIATALSACGIWLNLLLQLAIGGGYINFMAYVLSYVVQIAIAIDYASVIISKYKTMRCRFSARASAYYAVQKCVPMVLTSSIMLVFLGVGVGLASTTSVVAELCYLVARGAFISALLSIVVLPALLSAFGGKDNDSIYIERTPNLRRVFGNHRRLKRNSNKIKI